LAVAVVRVGVAGLPRAAEPEGTPPVSVRRVFVPAERMDQWPLGKQRYLPLDEAEFQRLLASAPAGSPRDGLPTAEITAARYTARLVNDQLQGEAVLAAAPTASVAGEVAWDNSNLAVLRAHWEGEQGQEASLALKPDGKQVLLVESAGRLLLEWSLAGRRDSAGGLHFTLGVPPCAVNRLVLDLAERWTPLSVPAPTQAKETDQRGVRRWEIDLGGRDRIDLCLMPANVVGQPESAGQVRQTTVYDFSQEGVEVSSQWNLDALSEPLYQVSLQLDPGLQLIAARCDDQPLSWSSVPLGDQGTRVDLLLPEPIQGGSHQFRMRALAAVTLEKPWPLPRIRAKGLFWQQGDATLLIPVPLALARFSADGCRQSGTGPLPSPRTGESVDFEFFSADGRVELTLQHLQPRLQAASGTTVEVAPGAMRAQVIVDLRVADGELFALQAELSRAWTISSLESLPAELISDWNVEQSDGRPRLEMLLSKALSPTRPVRLKIGLRRLYSAMGKRLTLSELIPLRFAAATERALLALRAVGPYEVRSSRGELGRMDPKKLEARELELFAERPEWLVALDDPNAGGMRVSLVRAKPGYRARLTTEVLAGSET